MAAEIAVPIEKNNLDSNIVIPILLLSSFKKQTASTALTSQK